VCAQKKTPAITIDIFALHIAKLLVLRVINFFAYYVWREQAQPRISNEVAFINLFIGIADYWQSTSDNTYW
jgi:hypothetical protein